MVIHLFPGWVNAGENGGSKPVKKNRCLGVNAGGYLHLLLRVLLFCPHQYSLYIYQ